MNVFRWFLMPFGLMYGCIMEVRNALFRANILKSAEFEVPIISVGNLSVGGTGKTPFVKYLLRNLSGEYSMAVLSRGYGRITKGYLVVKSNGVASNTGDEPLEIKQAFPDIPVCVCEDRVFGVAELMRDFPEVDLIILDDAFQHQYIKPKVSLILSKASSPFYMDFMMPAGRLREFSFNYKRADAIVFTGAKAGWKSDRMFDIPSFSSGVKYGNFRHVHGHISSGETAYILVTGLANHQQIEADMHSKTRLLKAFHYGDHHAYTEADVHKIVVQFPKTAWLTTHKDWVKLRPIITTSFPNVAVCLIEMDVEVYEEVKFKNWLKQKIGEN